MTKDNSRNAWSLSFFVVDIFSGLIHVDSHVLQRKLCTSEEGGHTTLKNFWTHVGYSKPSFSSKLINTKKYHRDFVKCWGRKKSEGGRTGVVLTFLLENFYRKVLARGPAEQNSLWHPLCILWNRKVGPNTVWFGEICSFPQAGSNHHVLSFSKPHTPARFP